MNCRNLVPNLEERSHFKLKSVSPILKDRKCSCCSLFLWLLVLRRTLVSDKKCQAQKKKTVNEYFSNFLCKKVKPEQFLRISTCLSCNLSCFLLVLNNRCKQQCLTCLTMRKELIKNTKGLETNNGGLHYLLGPAATRSS